MQPQTETESRPRGYITRARQWLADYVAPAKQISEADAFLFGGGATITSMLGSGRRAARERVMVYEKWSAMEGDPIVSTALGLHVTSALGGHETTGEVVFIEKKPGIEKDKAKSKLVDELAADLAPLFNRAAYTVGYNALAFGDAYARPYLTNAGLVDLYVDELVRPPLVQAYERGNRTVGYVLFAGQKMLERLSVEQLLRCKMPRTVWVPQPGVVEKIFRTAMLEDDRDKLPILPSMAGGSILYQAEEAYDNLYASLVGLVSHRWMDSIDESMVGVNLDSMTLDQQEKFLASVETMFKTSKARADDAVKRGVPILERIRHILPVFNEKQLVNVNPPTSGRNAVISIDDVMLHARLLAGALGTDLSMLGFSDQLSGGLGEGGFFRVSAQAAERSRIVRNALEAFFDDAIDLHCLHKYGFVYDRKDKPWDINFYGSISALESERQRTRLDAMSAGSTIATIIQQLKDAGADKETARLFMVKQLKIREPEAEVYAEVVRPTKPIPVNQDIPQM
jgi:hypothetical protein